jgi:hypothetical protein
MKNDLFFIEKSFLDLIQRQNDDNQSLAGNQKE